MAEERVAAFPLGTVLLPGQFLEVQVFEPRYRVMLFDLRDNDPQEFLVTLIERGSEVGGGDVRTEVGCMAEVVRTRELGDGRVLLGAVGTVAARVLEWLPEDPYPLAVVSRREPADPRVLPAAANDLRDTAVERAGAVISLAVRMGQQPPDRHPAWDPDPETATWQAALATPLGTLDRHRLLAEGEPVARLRLLNELLAETHSMLEALAGRDGAGE